MEKKQVIVISLLALAIVLSAASIIMNVSVISGVSINEAPAAPSSSEVAINILPSNQNSPSAGGNTNELG